MGAKIVSKRIVTGDKGDAVIPLIHQRNLAKVQPGFEHEEIWRHMDRPEEYLVVRAWDSENGRHNWQSNPQRIGIQVPRVLWGS